MSARLTLGEPADFDAVGPLVASCHAEMGRASSPEYRARAIAPLLEGIPHGALYLIGPRTAPIGYVALAFGWSIEFGGLEARLDELYIRPRIRGRGIATETLVSLAERLAQAGVVVIHIRADENSTVASLCLRAGFPPQGSCGLMTRRLSHS